MVWSDSVSVSVSQVELLLRIAVFGRGFFYNEDRWWNLLDSAPRMPFFAAKFGRWMETPRHFQDTARPKATNIHQLVMR